MILLNEDVFEFTIAIEVIRLTACIGELLVYPFTHPACHRMGDEVHQESLSDQHLYKRVKFLI